MNKTTTWILIVVALIIGFAAGFLVERQRAITNMENYKLTAQKMVDDAKMMAQKALVSPTIAINNFVMIKKDSKLGMIGSDSKNITLYTYDKDTAGKSNCTGQCAVIWPPYLATGPVPTQLPAHVGTMVRADGKVQFTWDGKPLYYYDKDKDAGDSYGDGVGGIWHIVKQ